MQGSPVLSCTSPRNMLYILGVTQPKLTNGRQPLTSRGKRNPMTANTRHIPGSSRCCGSALPLNATSPRRSQAVPGKSVQNPYKSDHFCECEFFTCSASTTCNFTALKCTHFPDALSSSPFDKQSPLTESHDAQPGRPVDCYPFSLGEKVRMRDKLVHSGAISPAWQSTSQDCTKPNKTERCTISFDFIQVTSSGTGFVSIRVHSWSPENGAKTVPFLCHFPRGRFCDPTHLAPRAPWKFDPSKTR